MNDNTNDRVTVDPDTGRLTFPPTLLPCPDWCTLPAGHGFESETKDGALVRYHVADMGEHVNVAAEEHAATNDGPVSLTGAPVITAWETDDLDVDAARALGVALAAAVDVLEAAS